MGDVTPFPKSDQLQRGPKRPARIKADALGWLAIRTKKLGTCRAHAGRECTGRVELHHIVPRSWGGDDLPENILPLCQRHHLYVTERRDQAILDRVAESLTDDEYAYCIDKLGEGALERLFGVLR